MLESHRLQFFYHSEFINLKGGGFFVCVRVCARVFGGGIICIERASFTGKQWTSLDIYIQWWTRELWYHITIYPMLGYQKIKYHVENVSIWFMVIRCIAGEEVLTGGDRTCMPLPVGIWLPIGPVNFLPLHFYFLQLCCPWLYIELWPGINLHHTFKGWNFFSKKEKKKQK